VRGSEQRAHLDNEASDRDVFRLADPVHPHDGLLLHRGIPPGVLHQANILSGLVRSENLHSESNGLCISASSSWVRTKEPALRQKFVTLNCSYPGTCIEDNFVTLNC
jgi:hypothetical protein